MKQIFKLTLVLTIFCHPKFSCAQTYIPDPLIDKFCGLWQWVNNKDTFQIVMQKQRFETINGETDVIVGWHRLVKNGVMVESNFQKIGQPFLTILGNSFGGGDTWGTNVSFTRFSEVQSRKWGVLRINCLNPNQIQWFLRARVDGPVPKQPFKVPTNVILTKVVHVDTD
jgi:hypothetical protein